MTHLTLSCSCFTDCIGAIVLAYERPEADLLLRPPRNPKTTKLVNWQLIFRSYVFVSMIETTLSFTMAYWYLRRKGIYFSDLWFKFGAVPDGVDPDYYTARLNEGSSIYFINLVVMYVSHITLPVNLMYPSNHHPTTSSRCRLSHPRTSQTSFHDSNRQSTQVRNQACQTMALGHLTKAIIFSALPSGVCGAFSSPICLIARSPISV